MIIDMPSAQRLHALFSGFAETGEPPAVFVLMGNFTSHALGAGADDLFKLKELFDRLADLIHGIDAINQVRVRVRELRSGGHI